LRSAAGRDSDPGWSFPLRLFLRPLLSLPAYSALDHAHPWLHLRFDDQRQHQRRGAQLHSQSFFRWQLLNRLFGIVESIACCFSQTYYDVVHLQHHKGNSDRKDEKGETVDWLSIYRHGHDGEAENPWSYVFLSFFRDNPAAIKRELRKRGVAEVRWGNTELAAAVLTLSVMFWFDWRYVVFFFLPFFLSRHCFSYLNGYFRHYGADPNKPIAWGVSSYGKIYNWLFFYNGYHAEHHFRPKVHWTQMENFHQQIAEMQRREGVRVIEHAHMLRLPRSKPPAA
jgi:fatty acid desaturase